MEFHCHLFKNKVCYNGLVQPTLDKTILVKTVRGFTFPPPSHGYNEKWPDRMKSNCDVDENIRGRRTLHLQDTLCFSRLCRLLDWLSGIGQAAVSLSGGVLTCQVSVLRQGQQRWPGKRIATPSSSTRAGWCGSGVAIVPIGPKSGFVAPFNMGL